MVSVLKRLFRKKPSIDFAELVEQGAQIIDVRTPAEFGYGHIEGSRNIPLQALKTNANRINKEKVIITCCASGVRSASAKRILRANGCEHVYNGGGWLSLNDKI